MVPKINQFGQLNPLGSHDQTDIIIIMDLCLHVYAMSMTFKIYEEYLMILVKAH